MTALRLLLCALVAAVVLAVPGILAARGPT
jgi:hypothetical protein